MSFTLRPFDELRFQVHGGVVGGESDLHGGALDLSFALRHRLSPIAAIDPSG
jgi:hypothetical protein